MNDLILYGTKIKTSNKSIKNDAPKFFEKIENENYNLYGKIKYAMITYEDELREQCNYYYVLYEKNINGYEKIIIPKSKWLLFRVNSQNASEIHSISQKFYLEFLPSCKYNLRDLNELEYYHDNVTDFLVPIC